MVLLVKGLRMGLGFASEAIHAARGSKDPAGPPPGAYAPEGYHAEDGQWIVNGYRRESDGAWIPHYYYAEDGSWIPNSSNAPASTEYTQAPNDAVADQLIRSGEAERFADDNGPRNEKALYDPSQGHREAIDQDEAVWRLDEMSASLAPPSYEDTMAYDEAANNAPEDESEESRFIRSEQKRENMVRNLVNMAGPVPANPARLSASVIIPQRRPHKRDRGFVRAYAPVLAEAGINQETFIQFIEDLEAANTANKMIEVVYVAAGIVGFVPGVATMVTSIVVQVVTGIAMELQKRGRQNSFMDRVNQELFMPRGLICMVASFKQQLPGQSLTSLYKKDNLGLHEAADKFNPDHYDEENKMKWTDKIRFQSAKTTEFELPEAAPLVYPNLELAAQQVAAAQNGGEQSQVGGIMDKMSRAGDWTQDYFDRRAHAKLEQENPGTALAIPADQRAPMKSRFNDPNHPANSGSLIALLSGGLIPVPGFDKMMAYKRDNFGVSRLIRGKTNDAEQYGMWMPKARLIKSVQKDVLYLLVMNLPTEEEIAESRAQVEKLHQQAQQAEYREPEQPFEQPVPETGLPPANFMGQI